MNKKLYCSLILLLSAIMRFILCYTIIVLPAIYLKTSETFILKAFLLLPLCIVSYVIISLSQFILIPAYIIASGSLLFVFQNNIERVLLFIFIFTQAFFMFDNIHKGKEKVQSPPLYLISIPIVFSIFLQGKQNSLASILFYLGIIYIFLNLLNKYLLNFIQFYKINESGSALPVHQMQIHSHLRIVVLFSIGFFILLLFSSASFNQIFLKILGTFFAELFLLLSKLPFFHLEGGKPLPYAPPPPGENSSNSLLWLIILFSVLILFLCISSIYKYLQYKKGVKNEYDEKTEFLSPFSATEISRERRKKQKNKSLLFATDINSKIRKLFYRRIKSGVPKALKISKNLTPSELYSLSLQHSIDEDSPFVNIYEKARYSGLTCTKDDLKSMKEN